VTPERPGNQGGNRKPRAERPRATLGHLWRAVSFQWPRKLGSLAFAGVIWFVATADRRTALERTFEVPIQVIDRSPDASSRVVTGLPRTVRVTLSGAKARLESLLPERIEVAVNVTAQDEGNFKTTVKVRTPAETDLKQLEPTQVSGVIDATISRSFTVEPGLSAPGQAPFQRLSVKPAQITVRGSRRQVDKVVRVVTVPGPLGPGPLGVETPTGPLEVYPLAVARSGGIVTGVQFSPAKLTLLRENIASSGIGAGAIVKTVPVRLAPLDPAWEVSKVQFSPARVRLVGPADVLTDISALEVRFPLQAGQFSVTALPVLPPGVAVLERIQVTLSARKKG